MKFQQVSPGLISATVTLIFCAAIYIPFGASLLGNSKTISEIEKRELSLVPALPKTVAEFESFPERFDDYYSDHFGFRDVFSRYYKLAKYTIGDSPSDKMTIGKNGWLFLGSIKKSSDMNSGAIGDVIGDARNANRYTAQQLEEIGHYMAGLQTWLDTRGIRYMLVIAPNKHTVYFEQLPDYISRVAEDSATDQLVRHLTEHTEVRVIDLRDTLIAEKARHQLYFKTDTHWNSHAANIAQYEIMSHIERMFPGKIEPELFAIDESARRKGGDLSNHIDADAFEEIDPKPVFGQGCELEVSPAGAKAWQPHTVTCSDQVLNALIFRDSFFTVLKPFFSRKFNRATILWERLNFSSLEKYVALEQPDIVIEQWVERALPYVPEAAEEFACALENVDYSRTPLDLVVEQDPQCFPGGPQF